VDRIHRLSDWAVWNLALLLEPMGCAGGPLVPSPYRRPTDIELGWYQPSPTPITINEAYRSFQHSAALARESGNLRHAKAGTRAAAGAPTQWRGTDCSLPCVPLETSRKRLEPGANTELALL